MKKIFSVVSIIQKVRNLTKYGSTCSTHPLSQARPDYPVPCSDKEIMEFLSEISNGVGYTSLLIGQIAWEVSGNCVGDELQNSSIRATRLPDGRYFIEVLYFDDEGKKIEEEWIYNWG